VRDNNHHQLEGKHTRAQLFTFSNLMSIYKNSNRIRYSINPQSFIRMKIYMYKYFQSNKNNSRKIQYYKEVKNMLQAFKNTPTKMIVKAFKESIKKTPFRENDQNNQLQIE